MFRLSRQSWFALAFAAVSAVLVYALARAGSKGPSIALETCQPVDVWARVSRAYDPLGFWVEQTLVLEDYYSKEALEDGLHDCRITHNESLADQQICIARVNKTYEAAQRCLAKANEMCRREGGRC